MWKYGDAVEYRKGKEKTESVRMVSEEGDLRSFDLHLRRLQRGKCRFNHACGASISRLRNAWAALPFCSGSESPPLRVVVLPRADTLDVHQRGRDDIVMALVV